MHSASQDHCLVWLPPPSCWEESLINIWIPGASSSLKEYARSKRIGTRMTYSYHPHTTTHGLREQAEYWPIKHHLCNNKLSLKSTKHSYIKQNRIPEKMWSRELRKLLLTPIINSIYLLI